MARVFISYRHVDPDQTVALFLYRYLSDRDHDVFIDAEEIPVGAFWDHEIRANVERAEWFVPLVSSTYLASTYILKDELKPAERLLEKRKIHGILQVRLAFAGKLPESVQFLDQIQAFKWRSAEDTQQLCEEIAERLPPSENLVKGMRAFGEIDGKIFADLGRAKEIESCLGLLRQPKSPYILLHGVSGSGKTSFVKAGLLPCLGDGAALVVELTQDTTEELTRITDGAQSFFFLDQFEQTL